MREKAIAGKPGNEEHQPDVQHVGQPSELEAQKIVDIEQPVDGKKSLTDLCHQSRKHHGQCDYERHTAHGDKTGQQRHPGRHRRRVVNLPYSRGPVLEKQLSRPDHEQNDYQKAGMQTGRGHTGRQGNLGADIVDRVPQNHVEEKHDRDHHEHDLERHRTHDVEKLDHRQAPQLPEIFINGKDPFHLRHLDMGERCIMRGHYNAGQRFPG